MRPPGAHNDGPESILDAPGVLHRAGQRAQALAQTMWKHKVATNVGVCEACGRLPARNLPVFGPRCDIAAEEWEVTQAVLRSLVSPVPGRQIGVSGGDGATRFVGRAYVAR